MLRARSVTSRSLGSNDHVIDEVKLLGGLLILDNQHSLTRMGDKGPPLGSPHVVALCKRFASRKGYRCPIDGDQRQRSIDLHIQREVVFMSHSQVQRLLHAAIWGISPQSR